MINVTTCPRCKGDGRIVETPCEACRGEGRLERKRTLQVTIPPGIDEGHQIRLSNEGEAGPRGGLAGSLYVAVHVTPHAEPQARRHGAGLRDHRRARAGGARDDDPRAHGRWRGERRGEVGHAARNRDPAARQGRALPASTRPARRPARDRRRRGPAPALAGAARGARGVCRRVRRDRDRVEPASSIAFAARKPRVLPRPPGQARAAPSRDRGDAAASHRRARSVAGARGRGGHRGGRGGQRDPRPRGTRRHERRAGVRPGRGRARRANRPEPASDDSRLRAGSSIAPRRSARSRSSPRRSATSRRSACGRSATFARASSTRPTGPRPGRRTSTCSGSAAGS